MQPLSAPFGETWEVLTGTRNRVGDRTLAVSATLERCVYWQNTPDQAVGQYPTTARDSAMLLGTLAVPRNSPAQLSASTELRRVATGEIYQVIGPPQFDHVHPLTGWDTGYKTVSVKAVT